ncbi:guanylate kinase [Candidatus Endomicrobiellum trichonymphae]|nr:guanylate kinase [Candidatus Endomicrobium trichonymphae]
MWVQVPPSRYFFVWILELNKRLNNSSAKSLGNIIIISAPSGAGKTAICNAVVKSSRNVVYSVSYTTRCPRKDETNGGEYFFIDRTEFQKMIEEGKFAEWAKVHGNYYGTSKVFLGKMLKMKKNILMDVDIQGGMSIKKQYPGACMIFVMPPDLKTLKERLVSRNKDHKKIIKMRLGNAVEEVKSVQKYEYLVINDKLDKAVIAVKTIIKSLKYKIQKNKKYFNDFF